MTNCVVRVLLEYRKLAKDLDADLQGRSVQTVRAVRRI